MKRMIVAAAILVFAAGCGKRRDIEFCEGVSPKGDGVHCGSVFNDGDLTALVRASEPFGVNTLTVRVYRDEKGKLEPADSIEVEVKPDAASTAVNLPLYRGGQYEIQVFKGDAAIAKGRVEIIEQ